MICSGIKCPILEQTSAKAQIHTGIKSEAPNYQHTPIQDPPPLSSTAFSLQQPFTPTATKNPASLDASSATVWNIHTAGSPTRIRTRP